MEYNQFCVLNLQWSACMLLNVNLYCLKNIKINEKLTNQYRGSAKGLGQVQNGHYQKSTAKTAGGHSSFKGLIVEESYECILNFLCILK